MENESLSSNAQESLAKAKHIEEVAEQLTQQINALEKDRANQVRGDGGSSCCGLLFLL